MWHEFEGSRTHTENGDANLEITKQRKLEPGDEVVIFQEKTNPLIGEVISVRVIDEDHARIIDRRPQGPPIETGPFVVSPSFDITKQDVAIEDPRSKEVKGVFWTNEAGIRLNPFISIPGRSYYSTDTDPETLKMREKLARWNSLAAEGKATGGAMGSGI